jgi:ferredoxin
MNHRLLKSFRVGIAIVFFLSISLAFLDFTGLFPDSLMKGSMWIQLVPSLLTFSRVLSVVACGFGAVFLITALFGRFYCSAICPLGILQDVIIRVAGYFREESFSYRPPVKWVRHIVFAFVVISILMGNLLVLSLLDPLSMFGRIFSGLIRPLVIVGNNMLASLLQHMDIYILSHVESHYYDWLIYLIPVSFLLLIILFSVNRGRIYCNVICPVGTLLGYLSRLSFLKIHINPDKCTRCGVCEEVCKAECVDSGVQKIDYSRCVACFDCLVACQFGAIGYGHRKKSHVLNAASKAENDGRRKAIGSLFAVMLFGPGLITGTGGQKGENRAVVQTRRRHQVIPPGSADISEFLAQCTACHLCVSACPTRVIQPAVDHFGLAHIMQVRMDYAVGFCSYECNRCTVVCPTGALRFLPLEDKKLTQLGKACFVKKNCIVITQGTACGACAEHCPTGAIQMLPYGDGLRVPDIDENVCIGCGACEYACPVRPNKAIYVEGNSVHVMAEKPERGEKASKTEFDGDFPF